MGVISYHDQTVCRATINNTHIRLLTASVPALLQAPTQLQSCLFIPKTGTDCKMVHSHWSRNGEDSSLIDRELPY